MPSFDKGPDSVRTPFGKNEFYFSTQDVKKTSYTFYMDGIPVEVIDGSDQKVLQPGTAVAKITSGPGAGKIGVVQAGVADGREVAANYVGVVETFLPWQLLHRDVEVAVVYEGALRQGWCFEYNAAGARIALTDATRDLLIAQPSLALLFR